ncbi:hypothetical protein NDU88_004573 [Pleurodeles waltl]|uniref:Uncharacterized protein n=1 Tax=Pleurodeles waltl TaxID=8319 RepID=A0AAV7TT33_PLEWA|nr:hypothetical protein NDU88_004573 [Pleurodeles waltl]
MPCRPRGPGLAAVCRAARARCLGRPGTAETVPVRATGRAHSLLRGASRRTGIAPCSGSPGLPRGPSEKRRALKAQGRSRPEAPRS